jgi:hypothetical protein
VGFRWGCSWPALLLPLSLVIVHYTSRRVRETTAEEMAL